MRCVVQRVTRAFVAVSDRIVGEIGRGLVALVGVEAGDTEKDLDYIVSKVAGLRVLDDAEGKMNLSVEDVGGAILAISQFTLLGDARGGKRPSFIQAEKPETANAMYETACRRWRERGLTVECGVFGAHMSLSLVNDGPVTILLDSKRGF